MMCEHEKEYTEGTILTSFPAKKSWICKKCGKRGYDIEGSNPDFERLKERFERKSQAHKRFV